MNGVLVNGDKNSTGERHPGGIEYRYENLIAQIKRKFLVSISNNVINHELPNCSTMKNGKILLDSLRVEIIKQCQVHML